MKLFGKSEEPGEPDPLSAEYRAKAARMGLPLAVSGVVQREIELIERLAPSSSEYSISISYLDYLLSMPWGVRTESHLDMAQAHAVLDSRHYGLAPIKERILEHIAVQTLRTAERPAVLLVDDDQVALSNLRMVFERENVALSFASNGDEALAWLAAHDCDVVVTDLKMPRMDGMELLGRIKALRPRAEVIFLTGYGTVQTAVEAMKAGAFHFLSKPYSLDDLRLAVRKAVEKNRRGRRSTTLCFAGPPGTGKTSLGRAVAAALGRNFGRISLGGIKDEAEIRGHRRTYAGAMPGRIIDEIRRVGSMNPVLVLDEVDKIGGDIKGDPASALLEVLDQEQNRRFTDHYLDVPFDLSDVMFILTANVAENIIEPLRDRMEVVRFSGYTEEEKVRIALDFLVPRQVAECGLPEGEVRFTPEAASRIVRQYTKEAGIRALDREVGSVCRKLALERVREGRSGKILVEEDTVSKFLGPRRYFHEHAGGRDRVGVAAGLVWTEAGGEIVFIETAIMKGDRELILTGSLGDVMRESARTALSYLRSNASRFGIDEDFFAGHDIHIHVPAGAIQKDGPSAGVTIALALLSLLSQSPMRSDIAATGEITLSGRILPSGGIKEKLLAARRGGIKTLVLPEANRPEVEAMGITAGMDIRYIKEIAEAADLVLGG